MSDYSYSEIQKMQEKAMARVRQMKKSTDSILERENKTTSFENTGASSMQVVPRVTNMPPNFPEKTVFPSFKEFFNEEAQPNKKAVTEPPKAQNNPLNRLENLFSEPDRAMLMGLVMLLKSEGADELLIMALIYILS